jgi:hypothetical protein
VHEALQFFNRNLHNLGGLPAADTSSCFTASLHWFKRSLVLNEGQLKQASLLGASWQLSTAC